MLFITIDMKLEKISVRRWILILAVLSLSLTALVEYAFAEKFPLRVKIVDDPSVIGISPTSDSLDFGEISRLSSQRRFVSLKNEGGSAAYISAVTYGDISPMVKLNKNNFFLEPGKEERLEFTIYVPPSAQSRRYDGGVIIFKLP